MTTPVFGARINWREPHETALAFLTDVMEADDGTEQRTQLRSIETRRESFTVSAYNPTEVALLNAVLYRRQGERMVVPTWPDITALTSGVSAGAVSLPCDTTDRGFVVGNRAVLWTSPTNCEAVEITSVSGSAVGVTPTGSAWSSGVDVIPARVGRLVGDVSRSRLSPIATDLTVAFDFETVETYGITDESADDEAADFLTDNGDFLTYGGAFLTTDTETYLVASGDLLTYGGDTLIYGE